MTNEAVYMAARETNYSNPSLKLCSAPDFKPLIRTLSKHIWQLSWDAISVSNKLKPIKAFNRFMALKRQRQQI